MSVFDATNPCPEGEGIQAPGDCTPAQHRALQDDVNAKCKGERRSCKGVTECKTLLENIERNRACANSRTTVADTCFRGGDAGHRSAIVDALNAAAYCTTRFNALCRPAPTPSPVTAPIADHSFMKKMEQLTGLTGAALVIYVIISEGSRLFPPRNLIPIP